MLFASRLSRVAFECVPFVCRAGRWCLAKPWQNPCVCWSLQPLFLREQVELSTKSQKCVDLEKGLAVAEERLKGTSESLGSTKIQLSTTVRCAQLQCSTSQRGRMSVVGQNCCSACQRTGRSKVCLWCVDVPLTFPPPRPLLPCRLLVQTEELRQVRAARDVDAAKLEALNAQVAELQRSEARLRDQVQQLSTASTSRVGQLHAPC
jgi:hypothetical protein